MDRLQERIHIIMYLLQKVTGLQAYFMETITRMVNGITYYSPQ